MKTEYLIVIIQSITTIIAALIGGWFSLHKEQKKHPDTRPNSPKWLWILIGAVVGFLLSQSVWLFKDIFSPEEYFERTVEISSQKDWQNSGIYIYQGETFEVIARNEKWNINSNSSTNADGTGSNSYFSSIGLNASLGSLIARIDDSQPFSVGKSAKFTSEYDGELYFRIHDENLTDNSGSITIRIKVWR